VSQVLDIYSRVRQPFATEVSRRSRLNGGHFSLRSLTEPDHDEFPFSARLQGVTKQIQENSRWLSEEMDWGADLQRATNLLQAELAA
jgi:hypothetical protein